MVNPVCSRCIYLTNKPETFRRCPVIPIIHRDMCCSNPENTIKDNISGESYKPYCEEINRHAECLFYYPKGLEEVRDISFNVETSTVCITGTNKIIFTTDGTELTAEIKPQENSYDENTGLYSVEIQIEHTCTVKAVCLSEGVISSVKEIDVEVLDSPAIEFNKETNTVSIESYNKILYTTDGSDVTEDSFVYEKPFVISRNTTIKACSFARNEFSEQTEKYCVSMEKPVINFAPETNVVSIDADDTILFSIDGSDIYDDSDRYEEPFEIEKNTLVKAACIIDGELSEQAEFECKVLGIPVIDFDKETGTVSITAENTVLYTTDGNDVRKKDLEYKGPFKISDTTVIKAVSIVDNKMSEQAELICSLTE